MMVVFEERGNAACVRQRSVYWLTDLLLSCAKGRDDGQSTSMANDNEVVVLLVHRLEWDEDKHLSVDHSRREDGGL